MSKTLLLASFITGVVSQLLVTLPNGQIQGKEQRTFTNRTFQTFLSIPFATPPLGDLRFQEPQPAKNWTGILNATEESNICYQHTEDHPEENEDCLYINVFTPVLDRTKNNYTKLPVKFFIYGGGLRDGAARVSSYRPEYWMDEDIILVTFNYRVGIFGFLSTGDSIIPGNNGLKDQRLALHWTHSNIHLFGGDRDKITVSGQSAGAVSAGYHLLSKQSAGLFRGVIQESGSPMNMYALIENPKEYALQLVQAISPNISSNASSEEIRDFLLSLDARYIDGFSRATKIYQPSIVIEPESSSAAVTYYAYEQFEVGDFFKVPVLMGICSEEGITIATSNDYLKNLGLTYDADESLVVPEIFPHDAKITLEEIGNSVKLIYLNESQAWTDHPGRVVRHHSDQRYVRAVIKQGKLISKFVPVYFYQFSYDGELGGWSTVVEDAERVGHAEELNYLFLKKALDQINDSDALTHKRLVRLLSNFIKYQNPTPEADDLFQNVTWPTASPIDYKYLNINVSLSIETNPRAEFSSKWENLFEAFGRRPFTTF